MEKASLPTLIEFAAEYTKPVFKSGLVSIVLYTNDKAAEYNKVFKEAAQALEGEILFVTTGSKSGIQKRLSEFSLVDEAQMPVIRILMPGNEFRRFSYNGTIEEITVSSIKSFIDNVKAGTHKQDYKSEPEVINHDDVYTIVGTNWDTVVNDPTKDVFVFYFAAFSRECKELYSVWDELAIYTKASDDLVIARFNAPQNEVENLTVPKYPYFLLYPKDNKQGVEFREPVKTLDTFKIFLNEHSSAFREHYNSVAGKKNTQE